MPTIAIVDGVAIVLWPNDHPPPHIHAVLGDDEARISIEKGQCLSGGLPRRKMRSVPPLARHASRQGRLGLVGAEGRQRSGQGAMKRYRIVQVEVPRFPVVRLTFDDGLVGDVDLAQYIGRGSYFACLADRAFFWSVSIGENGRFFGWRLDELGHEIDFGADAARAEIETAMVEERAARYRERLSSAAE